MDVKVATNTEFAEQKYQQLPQVLDLLAYGRYGDAAALLETTGVTAEQAGDPTLITVSDRPDRVGFQGSSTGSLGSFNRERK